MIGQHQHNSVLLLSGGLDSTALAAVTRPAMCLFVDYGQRAAKAERNAATVISTELGLRLEYLALDLRPLGGGLLHDGQPLPGAPSPEWWPFRNQFLVTAAAAIALRHGLAAVHVGSVSGDGDRHVDGTARFFNQINDLTSMQEGNVTVSAPALDVTTEELIAQAGLRQSVLGWTTSCHVSDLPCHACPGCWKRERVFERLGLFRDPGHV